MRAEVGAETTLRRSSAGGPAAARAPLPSSKRFLSLADFEAAARRRLPRPLFEFVAGAAEENASLAANRAAFARYALIPRVLRDVTNRSSRVTVLDRQYDLPVGIAPMGICAMTGYRGDIAMARAAEQARIPMILSGSSLIPLEEVIAHHPTAWFQAYIPGEPAAIRALLDRVRNAGYQTLVVTADVPLSGNRENNIRSGFSLPLRPTPSLAWQGLTHPRWLLGTALRTLLNHGMPHFENAGATRGAPVLSKRALREFNARDRLDWSHLRLVRQLWTGRLVVKGILSPYDAVAARDCGADGLIISNHGGRQLDGAIAPLRVLARIVDAVSGLPVMLDGGVRRGTDVLKAMALGATLVFVGRPFNYAAAVAGEAGIAHAVRILAEEIGRDMALMGLNRLDEIGPADIEPVDTTVEPR